MNDSGVASVVDTVAVNAGGSLAFDIFFGSVGSALDVNVDIRAGGILQSGTELLVVGFVVGVDLLLFNSVEERRHMGI